MGIPATQHRGRIFCECKVGMGVPATQRRGRILCHYNIVVAAAAAAATTAAAAAPAAATSVAAATAAVDAAAAPAEAATAAAPTIVSVRAERFTESDNLVKVAKHTLQGYQSTKGASDLAYDIPCASKASAVEGIQAPSKGGPTR